MLEDILAKIDAEIDRLRQARSLLVQNQPSRRDTGRGSPAVARKRTKRRTLSVEAREKIRQAQLKRWSVAKKIAKKGAK
jgi:hypothetical protein